ncbi:MAG: glycine cleavage system protein GcvH [Methanomassiliicoccaceae archaeon]|nr:glycine cleavage system protein GcvH [Methanomassiliicoccaceae archaeon]
MAEVRNDLLYTKTHDWVRKADNGTVVVGITDHAQHEIGDVLYIEVPEAGRELEAGEEMGALESVKTVEPLYAPISGRVIRSNALLDDTPDTVNTSPYDDGWLAVIELSNVSELNGLMDADAYRKFLG